MFGKKQKKLDSRIRFQHQAFTRKLDQARGYKRQPQGPPSEPVLQSRRSQIIAAVAGAILVYLVFIPNFLSPKTVNIEGAGGDDANHVRSSVEGYFKNSPFYLAQNNLVFLNKSRLQAEMLEDSKVYKVSSIKKNFFRRSLTVVVELKAQKYIVNRGGTILGVYNDGIVQEQLSVEAEKWLELNPGSVKVKHDTTGYVAPNTKYFSDELMTFMDQLRAQLRSGNDSAIDYFAIPTLISAAPPVEEDLPVTASATTAAITTPPVVAKPVVQQPVINEALPLQPESLHVYVKRQGGKNGSASDIRVIFDTKQDIPQALAKLSLLFQQTPPERYSKFYYIDLRFENRAFVCLVDAVCAQTNN